MARGSPLWSARDRKNDARKGRGHTRPLCLFQCLLSVTALQVSWYAPRMDADPQRTCAMRQIPLTSGRRRGASDDRTAWFRGVYIRLGRFIVLQARARRLPAHCLTLHANMHRLSSSSTKSTHFFRHAGQLESMKHHAGRWLRAHVLLMSGLLLLSVPNTAAVGARCLVRLHAALPDVEPGDGHTVSPARLLILMCSVRHSPPLGPQTQSSDSHPD
mmetsp:Transcript_20397/g.62140  ORF Transcript_20397/g.62140 Transcript_20397/m.62140 type:complete len:216 (+) Transcript_20397:637-1284(+)